MKNFKRFLVSIIGVAEFLWASKKELFYGLRFIIAFFWIAFAGLFVASLFTHGTSRGEIVEMGLYVLENHPILSVSSILIWIIPMAYFYSKEKLSQHSGAVKI